jgi:hypothetical protein
MIVPGGGISLDGQRWVSCQQVFTASGLFASGHNIAHARELLGAPIPREQDKRRNDGDQPEPRVLAHPCPWCGGRMIVIETFERGRAPRASSLGEDRHVVIEIASPATPQLSSLLPPRRRRSPNDAPGANTAAAKNMIPLPRTLP